LVEKKKREKRSPTKTEKFLSILKGVPSKKTLGIAPKKKREKDFTEKGTFNQKNESPGGVGGFQV